MTDAIVFVDFNTCHLTEIAPRDGEDSLMPTILAVLSQGFGGSAVTVPGQEIFTLQGGTSDGALSLGVFRARIPVAAIFVGSEDGRRAWNEMDGLCHRTFGSPLGQLKMPLRPWAVLVRFSSQSVPAPEWIGAFARGIAWSWVAGR
jgi:hypothetical protein